MIKNILPFYFVEKIILQKNKREVSPNKPEPFFYNPKTVNSYSQTFEDLIIDGILKKQKGFYIDIGANDPEHLSNTKRFYDIGWEGINIEPNPLCIQKFNIEREKDINLNVGIGNQRGEMKFYELTYSSLSSFDKEMALYNSQRFNVKIEKEYFVKVIKLFDVFNTYVKDKEVDFVSIDTEGYEMEVLKSNDWQIFRPKLILIETGLAHTEIHDFLIKEKYAPVLHNGLNSLFVDQLI